jgi:hypothetical protein
MWGNIKSITLDIGKKLLVTLLATPIVFIATKYIWGAISIAALSYSTDWYAEYWYLIVLAAVVAVFESYVLYKRPSAFATVMFMSIGLTIVYSLNRLHIFEWLSSVPLWTIFLLFHIVAAQLAIIGLFLSWRILVNIIRGSQDSAKAI